jgi:hypothetical protein
MSEISTLLIEITPKGKFEIIDLKELLNIESNYSDVFNFLDKFEIEPSKEVVNRVLREL